MITIELVERGLSIKKDNVEFDRHSVPTSNKDMWEKAASMMMSKFREFAINEKMPEELKNVLIDRYYTFDGEVDIEFGKLIPYHSPECNWNKALARHGAYPYYKKLIAAKYQPYFAAEMAFFKAQIDINPDRKEIISILFPKEEE